MPFYDLYCHSCEKEHNVMATMAEKVERKISCPDCGSTEMDTVYNAAPNFIRSMGDSMPSCPNRSSCGSTSCART